MIALLLAASLSLATPDLTCRVRSKVTGKVYRSEARKRLFMRLTGFPNGRPGHVVDHILALRCGGCDLPSNMAWQTITEAKAKDRWEDECKAWWDGTNLRLLESMR